MRITRRLEFDAGHRIPNHGSQCRHLHGHRYALEITLSGPIIATAGAADEGMVMDFSEVKSIAQQHVVEPWDHAFLAWRQDDAVVAFLGSVSGHKTVLFDAPPSNVAQHVPFAIGHFSGLERKSNPTLPALRDSAPSTPTKLHPASIPHTPPSAVRSASSTPTMTPSKNFGDDSVETPLTGSLLHLSLPAIVQNLSPASKAFVAASAATRNPATLEFTVKVTDVSDTAVHFGLSYMDQAGREREAFVLICEALDTDGRFNDHTTGCDDAVVTPESEWKLKAKTPVKISSNFEGVLRAAENSVIEKARTTTAPVNTPIGKFLTNLKNDTGNPALGPSRVPLI